MTHTLKTWPEYFNKVKNGFKTFEVRKDDRLFNGGDNVILQEWDPDVSKYTGAEIEFTIGYVLRDFPALKKGYCVFSLLKKDDYE